VDQIPTVGTEFEVDHTDYRDICAFCSEVSGVPEHNAFVSFMPDIDPAACILYETERFVVIPCVGAACDGYVLIVPKEHVLSIGHLSCENDPELTALLNQVCSYLREQYGLPIVAFEHGAESFRNRGGACTDHAHVHLLPASLQIDLLTPMRVDFEPRRVADLSNATREQVTKRRRPYLWVQEQNGEKWVCDAPDALSQYIRRILLSQLGRRDEWDWAVFPGQEYIRRTIAQFHEIPLH
jgi:diadenosine tetraphosphate (Ap4A) HIT family hydrolase